MADTYSLHKSDMDADPNVLQADAKADESLKRKTKKKSSKAKGAGVKGEDTDVKSNDSGENTAHGSTKKGASDLPIIKHISQIQNTIELLSLPQGPPKSLSENLNAAKQKSFQFWKTQAMPKFDEQVKVNEEIEADKPREEIRQEPMSLPAGFTWDTLDISEPHILQELYTLLSENYVEDDFHAFRFDYSPGFLQWALQPPGYFTEWHCGVRAVKSKKLVCFISAVPARINIYDASKKMVEINFLCVHKKLQGKRVAPVLIKEVTRRVHLQGLFQAVYTAGVVLPTPVASVKYFNRCLNVRKLIEANLFPLSRNTTMQKTIKLYKLPDDTKTPGFREMKESDLPEAFELVTKYMLSFKLFATFTEDDFRHWFLPRADVVYSFVVEGDDGKLSDFASFYSLPSTIVQQQPSHKQLRAAYSFYNASTKTPWTELMQDVLVVAKNLGFDMFNALELMDNREFLAKLKFISSDVYLHYYVYNWKCPRMEPSQIGLVLQ